MAQTPNARRKGAEAQRREQAERAAAQIGADPEELHAMAWAIIGNVGGPHRDRWSYTAGLSAAMAAMQAQQSVQARRGFRAGEVVGFVNDDGERGTGEISGWTPLRGQAFVTVGDEPYGIVHVDDMIRLNGDGSVYVPEHDERSGR